MPASRSVTVVISTLDRPALLGRCLDALLAGSLRPAAVVVVDQGSSDAAGPVVEAARVGGLDVTRLRQERLGLSTSQNTGVSAARTPVVAIVDDDCVPDESWVAVVDAAFAGRREPLLLTGRVLPLPASGDRVLALSVRDSTGRSEWTRSPMPWHVGTGGNFAVTREAFVAVGGNDVRLGTGSPGRGGNDLDLFHRLLLSGAPARYEPDLVVHHERATVDEFQSRLGSYGFGMGAMLGLWLRRRDLWAFVVLAAWLRMRARLAWRSRSRAGVVDELKVLAGTARGLAYGIRVRRREPTGA